LVKKGTALAQMLIGYPLCLLWNMLAWELNWVCAPRQLLQQRMHLTSVSMDLGSH